MSLNIRFYKKVTRNYIEKLFDNLNRGTSEFSIASSYSEEKICSEFIKQGYDSFNMHIEWCRINFHLSKVIVEPIYEQRPTD